MTRSSPKPDSLDTRLLTRRALLVIGGMSGISLLAACGTQATTTSSATSQASAAAQSSSGAAPATTQSSSAAPSSAAAATAAPTVRPVEISTASPPTATPAAQAAAGGTTNAWGRTLPSDAAPSGKQVTISGNDSTGVSYKTMDFNDSVYSRAPLADEFNSPLTRIDKDFNIHPGHAAKWDLSKDGLTWTFTLKPAKWTDGKDVTANDYVQTFRYTADPKHAWDFTWYWDGIIKNYGDALKGKVPTSQIGVRQGGDPLSLIIETEAPVPYLPAQLLYSWPLSAAGLEKYGSGIYNTNPQSVISFGPYTLQEWSPDRRVVISPNKQYKGDVTPYLEQQIGNIYKGGSMLQRFQAGEIDSVSVTANDLKVAKGDAKLKDLHVYVNPQDFEIWYAFFDVTKKPFDNVKVRQAFAHSADRDSIVKNLLAPLAIPAYGYLMPGFPSAIEDPLKPLTNYDPAMAKKLLADGGYPNGQGFPEVTFYYYPNNPTTPSVVQALAAGWQQVLGVKITLQQLDKTTYYKKVNAKPTEIPFGWISYGMDYFDASNMLGVYKGGGRHNWNNGQYDKLLAQAGPETDQDKRNGIYADAQKLLTGDAPAVFVYHPLFGYLYQPFYKGSELDKDKFGYDGLQFGAAGTTGYGWQTLYIANDVDKYRHTT